jgi:anthranilate synthase component 2
MKHVLVVDNFDSFTYNLVHYLQSKDDVQVNVFRNHEITVEQAAAYDAILLSPGPGLPQESGQLIPLLRALAPTKKILGVCLGHQAIGEVFHANLRNLNEVCHGQSMQLQIIDKKEVIFSQLPERFNVGRYHSWVVDRLQFPEELIVTAVDENGEIMAMRHVEYNVRGLQFHPESILSEFGKEMINNWLYRS